jgi:3-oxoacyl-[acyl-carrier protein] reductase
MAWTPDTLAGRVALVTGSTRGIGRAIAAAYLGAGARVWLNGRDPAAVEALTAELAADHGDRVQPLPFDVADPAAIRAGFQAIMKADGKLDVLVNNAGLLQESLIEMAGLKAIDDMLAVNLRGVILCSQLGARLIAKAGGGGIINIASMIGRVGNPGQVVYGATKAGVIGITLGLAKELGSRRIRVNAIAPGIIDTELLANLSPEKRAQLLGNVPLGRVGEPADVANLALFLASDAAAYITGQVIGVDGGWIV